MSAGEGKKSALVPKLRFPEFRNAEGWKPKLLGEVCGMQAGKFIAASEISEKQSEGLHPCFGGNGLRGYTNNYNQSGRYSLIGRQGALCGNVNLVEGDFYATEHAVVTTPKVGISTDWNFYNLCLLNLNRFATGQAQPGLSVDVLEKVNCAVPKDEEEQQKIADCLSSLDELIAAQGRKVEALKTYKRGLMQQLFPREGQTLPRLRFPEFRDAGEWEEYLLSQISPVIYDGTHQTPTYTSKGVPFYSVENLISGNANKFISHDDYLEATRKNRPQKNDILLTRIGKIGHSAVVTWDHEFSVYVTLAVIQRAPKFDSYYMHYFIQSERYQSELRSRSLPNAVPPKINLDSLRSTKVLLPEKDEQQRIADSLSALDNQISVASAKLNTLKSHKKGLMQQLFPSLEES